MADWNTSLNQKITAAYQDFLDKCNAVGEDCPYPVDAFLARVGHLLGAGMVMCTGDVYG